MIRHYARMLLPFLVTNFVLFLDRSSEVEKCPTTQYRHTGLLLNRGVVDQNGYMLEYRLRTVRI